MEANACVVLSKLLVVRITELDDAMDQRSNPLKRLGNYSGVAVTLSVVACYGTLVLIGLLSLTGVSMSVHEGAWAAVIVALVWVAVIAIGMNIERYRSFGPFVMADAGALLVSWAMIVDYSQALELGGFALLIGAALWDRQRRKRAVAPIAASDKEAG